MPRVKLIQHRGGTAAQWTAANPVLALREKGVETDTLKEKLGDGVTAWTSLAYFNQGGGSVADATTTTKGIVQLAGDLGGTAASPTTPTAVHLTGSEVITGQKTTNNSTDQTGIIFNQNAALATNRYGIEYNWNANNTNISQFHRIYSNFAHTDSNITRPMSFLQNNNSASVASVQTIIQNGSGNVQNIDINGVGKGIDIDHDANTASELVSLKIDTANAGAGGSVALDATNGKIRSKNYQVTGSSTVGHVLQATDTVGNLTLGPIAITNVERVFNVKDYGALGNGSTNDRTAIQAAIVAANTAGGGVVFFPNGTYMIGSTIGGLYSNITLRGSGRNFTTIKAMSGIVMVNFGNGDPTGGTYSNIRIENLSLDGGGFGSDMFNVTLGSVVDSSVYNVHFKNLGSGAHAWLFVGVSTNASSAMVSRNFVIDNCIFSDNQAGWEGITLSQMLNVKIINTVIRDKPNGFGLLNYGSHDVSVTNTQFINTNNSTNGFGMTTFTGCSFQKASMLVLSWNTSFINCTWDSTDRTQLSSLTFLGYFQSPTESFWDAMPANSNVSLKNLKVIGCTFKNTNAVAIRAGVFTGGDTNTYLSVDDIQIINCSFERSYWQGIDVKGLNVTIKDCTSFDNGQLGTTAVKYNYVIAGKKLLFENNRSYDDQLTPTVTRDLFIDNQYSATLIPTQTIQFINNTLEVNPIPQYYDGSIFSTTKPANITLTSTDANSQRIVNVLNPTNAQDAANKSYVDAADTLKANDADVVKLAGSQTITGTKTLSNGAVLSPIATPAYTAGQLYFDSAEDALTFYSNDPNVMMNIGQEQFVRARNDTGATIANGVPVVIGTAPVSGIPNITLAINTTQAGSQSPGLTTETIANGAIGYVSVQGKVRNLNTSAFTAGATLYVGNTAGSLTSTIPTESPTSFISKIGTVLTSNATTGVILVAPEPASLFTVQGATVDLGTVLSNAKLRTAGQAWPITTSGTVTLQGVVSMTNALKQLGVSRNATGTLTATSVKNNEIDATSAAVVLTLPVLSGNAGLIFEFIKTDATANSVTIKGNGTEVINGVNTYVISTQYKYVVVRVNSTATAWLVVGNN